MKRWNIQHVASVGQRKTLATSLPVAQWLELPTSVRKVMRSIPVGDSDFFFVPRSRHAEYSIFSYFFSELKLHHLSLFITYRALRHR